MTESTPPSDNDLRPDVRFGAMAMIKRATAKGAERPSR